MGGMGYKFTHFTLGYLTTSNSNACVKHNPIYNFWGLLAIGISLICLIRGGGNMEIKGVKFWKVRIPQSPLSLKTHQTKQVRSKPAGFGRVTPQNSRMNINRIFVETKHYEILKSKSKRITKAI